MFIKNLIGFLVIFSISSGLILSKFNKLFGFMFILVYVGAILVLMFYVYSSQMLEKKNMFLNMMFFLNFKMMLMVYFLYKKSNYYKEKDLKKVLYKKNEVFLVIFLCIFILLMLFCLLKLDFFRFSSLRSKI